MRGGLTGRIATASVVLAGIIGGVFAVLVWAVAEERETARLALRSQEALATANELERLVLDIETGERGYLLTRDERFLEPWNAARKRVPEVGRRLVSSTVTAEQGRRAQRIVRGTESYIDDYSVPLVRAARAGDTSAGSAAALAEGRRRIDALRVQFDLFSAAERALGARREADSGRTSRWAIGGAVGGAVGSAVLIGVFAVYLTRSLVRPVRRAAVMSGRLAGGDLATRMPETGIGEIGTLERSFNTMGRSLERSRGELSLLATEQAALRRVATLAANGVPQQELFSAVTSEVGQLFGVDGTRLLRYESDGSVTALAGWGLTGLAPPLGDRVMPRAGGVVATVARTGRPARAERISEPASPSPVRSAVGVPIVVEGRTWGVMTALFTRDEPAPARVEARFGDFTDLVATAIANGQARADLVASRARVVTATDRARHRIERDLHDGVQQRLVSLALDLRAAETDVPADARTLRRELRALAEALGGVLDDLREISRGIHPAILSEAGLPAALRALARRSGLSVDLDVVIGSRLPQQVEVAAYYVAAEALTNAVKHAQASTVWIHASVRDGALRLTIRDDGSGGADPVRGSGLVGLTDRVEALGGTLVVTSPPAGGTELAATMPLDTG
ncbi:MAG TPA: CHASE3 domain-containing protein [Actinocatenispora sp.]